MPSKNRHSKSTAKNAETIVADRILELLDRGELPPWHRPWRINPNGNPCNAVTQRPYRGINTWLTRISQELFGYDDHRWLTLKQANAAGGHVNKGERATKIIFWKTIHKEDPNASDVATYPLAVIYNIFNVEQTTSCNIPDLPKLPQQPDPIEQAEAIIASMPNPPQIQTYETDNIAPHYRPIDDVVRIPDSRRYDEVELYYNTVYHELTHSTGHPKRLNRFTPTEIPNIHDYGIEELVAGMGSAMLADLAGIGHATLQPDASYIQHWSQTIRANRSIILSAAQRSQKAVDYIMNREPEFAASDDGEKSP